MKFLFFITAIAGFGAAGKCPSAGTTNAAGQYSCNPAHDYGSNQKCVELDGCYYLQGPNNSIPQSSAAKPTQTGSACPPPGSRNDAGAYSCNPAHGYPEGQDCKQEGDCYFLRQSEAIQSRNETTPTELQPSITPTTIPEPAGAASVALGSVGGGLAVVMLVFAML